MAPKKSIDALQRVPLLSGLSKRDLQALAQTMEERTFAPGRHVVVQGRRGVGFFIILDGEAAVTVGGDVVRMLGPGDWFGETALIQQDVRTATVTADSELRCLTMTAWNFKPFVLENPKVAWSMLETMAQRTRDGG
jgi:CRP/FNR family transcriptional regulator, cyclic AMP receptor protein